MNRIVKSLTLCAGCLVLGGCAWGSGGDVSYRAIANDLTPELRGIAERPIDVDRHMAATNNGNIRAMSDDIGRIFYTDYPSRLSPFPIFSNSGMPR